jgi:hypothetical protein
VTAQGLFGDSQLLAEVGPRSGNSAIDSEAGQSSETLDGWTEYLYCVDDALMLRVWRRLLADEEIVSSLLSDDHLKELHVAINDRLVVPADTNPSFLARALIGSSDVNRVLSPDRNSLRDGEVRRVVGSVSFIRGFADGWTLRIERQHRESMLVRFSKEAFLQSRPLGLRSAEVVVLAVVSDARKTELAGIAIVVRMPV